MDRKKFIASIIAIPSAVIGAALSSKWERSDEEYWVEGMKIEADRIAELYNIPKERASGRWSDYDTSWTVKGPPAMMKI